MMYIDPIAKRAWNPSEIELNSPAREKMALKELEQLFIFMLMKEMRKTVPESDGFFAESSELKMYQEMMDDVISEKMAEAGQFGLAKMVGEQLRIHELSRSVGVSGERDPIPFKKEPAFIDLAGIDGTSMPLDKREPETEFIPFSDRKTFAL